MLKSENFESERCLVAVGARMPSVAKELMLLVCIKSKKARGKQVCVFDAVSFGHVLEGSSGEDESGWTLYRSFLSGL